MIPEAVKSPLYPFILSGRGVVVQDIDRYIMHSVGKEHV